MSNDETKADQQRESLMRMVEAIFDAYFKGGFSPENRKRVHEAALAYARACGWVSPEAFSRKVPPIVIPFEGPISVQPSGHEERIAELEAALRDLIESIESTDDMTPAFIEARRKAESLLRPAK